ncbi:BTAD domain-containing putative transcriptional regulator [Actinocrispum wychmicini]|uniref:Putative ATPase n=1 Tax=Actinocrispum wychmicini TaxID=1213861 RepID=A0A4R2JV33_9PSEU|nr:BTAD domain-containing putative transcriptional regulator [Actinocrispum wychmicini]TCO58005.1 putative ATPase [Actinocrispum wychmicini]
MRVAMLGPLSLRDAADREIEVGGIRLRMLLVRLALDAGRIVPNESLIDGLWGERPPVDATNALQSLVSRLRKAGIAKQLESHSIGYSLAATDVDVHTFERLAAEGGRLLREGQTNRAAEVLREALDLWRGPALVDVADAPFAGPTVARLAEQRLTALEDRVDADIRRGRDADVIVELYALTREHPLRERLAGLLIQALHGVGRQADAINAFETVKRALADELGVDPGPQLREIHLAVLREKPAKTPGTALPAQLTSFVGRHTELAELGKVDDRLVTLVGPGGVGKTRLATEAAGRVTGRVWFVHLAGLREAVDVPVALAAALGLGDIRVPDGPGIWTIKTMDVTTRLVDALKNRADLVVLDNCEHLISAAANLADTLLAGCPTLRIMATSREPLAITGETLVPVGPLDLPDEQASPDQAMERAAVRLFLDRAVAVRPGFTVDEHNVAAVVAICRQLDGLPLALELAAARLRSMTVGQVVERLDDRFRLLTGGSRTSLPRHQTLGAVVEWSWGLLSEPERTLAGRLSVFATGATLEAVTAVCAGDDLPSADVLYVLASLVEKSLVEAIEGADGVPRYRMLQTVRAFAAARLVDADEVRARFTGYMLAMIEELEPKLRGPDQLGHLATMDADRQNILAALRIAVDRGDGDTSFRIGAAWTWYWLLRQGAFADMSSEHSLPLERMKSLAAQAPPDAQAAVRILEMAGDLGIPDRPLVVEMIDVCRELGPGSRYPVLVLLEPIANLLAGDHAEAVASLARTLRNRDPWVRAAVASCAAMIVINLGDLDRAERWFRHGVRAFRRLGDRWGLMLSLSGLGEIKSIRGDITGAIADMTESAKLEAEMGPLSNPPMTCARIAEQLHRAGDLDGAERELMQVLRISEELVQPTVTVAIRCRLGAVARARGDLVAAREHLVVAREIAEALGHTLTDNLVSWVDCVEMWVLADEGRVAEARALGRSALSAIQSGFMADNQGTASVGEALAAAAAADGDLPLAARLLGVSAAVRGAVDRGSPAIRDLMSRFGEPERQAMAEAQRLPQAEALAWLYA